MSEQDLEVDLILILTRVIIPISTMDTWFIFQLQAVPIIIEVDANFISLPPGLAIIQLSDTGEDTELAIADGIAVTTVVATGVAKFVVVDDAKLEDAAPEKSAEDVAPEKSAEDVAPEKFAEDVAPEKFAEDAVVTNSQNTVFVLWNSTLSVLS